VDIFWGGRNSAWEQEKLEAGLSLAIAQGKNTCKAREAPQRLVRALFGAVELEDSLAKVQLRLCR
jgi:hypothetical protein